MDKDLLVGILNEMLKNRDFSKIVEKVPYEDRFALFMKTHEIEIKNDLVYSLVVENIFVEEEADSLYDQIEDRNKRKILFTMLSDEKKIANVDELKLESWEITKFVFSLKNEQYRYNVACKFLKDRIFNPFSLAELVGCFSETYKFQILEEILKYYNDEEHRIRAFNYDVLMGEFEEKDRYIVLKKLLGSDDEFSYMYICAVLSKLPVEERLSALDYILTNFLEKYKESFYSLGEILSLFSEEDFYNVLSTILDKGLLDNYSIINMLENYDLNKNMEIIDFLIDYGKKNNRELINDYTIAKVLDKLPREEGVKVYHKYAIDTPGFGNIRIARYCLDIENKYFYLVLLSFVLLLYIILYTAGFGGGGGFPGGKRHPEAFVIFHDCFRNMAAGGFPEGRKGGEKGAFSALKRNL